MWCRLICVCKWNAPSFKISLRGIRAGRPPKLFDRKWWMRYGSELWGESSSVWFSFSFVFKYFFEILTLTTKELTSCSVQLHSQSEWRMTQTALGNNNTKKQQKNKKTIDAKVGTATESGQISRFIETNCVLDLFVIACKTLSSAR